MLLIALDTFSTHFRWTRSESLVQYSIPMNSKDFQFIWRKSHLHFIHRSPTEHIRRTLTRWVTIDESSSSLMTNSREKGSTENKPAHTSSYPLQLLSLLLLLVLFSLHLFGAMIPCKIQQILLNLTWRKQFRPLFIPFNKCTVRHQLELYQIKTLAQFFA